MTEKQRKILDKVQSHQLILLENPPSISVEEAMNQNKEVQVKKFLTPPKDAAPVAIIKPSSLNYKVSLRLSVEEFVKKEAKIPDFTVKIVEGDNTASAIDKELDDALFQNSNAELWAQEDQKAFKKLEKNSLY